jgi:hypothetical protein
MHLSKAIKEFPIRRLARSTLPVATALQDACKEFQAARGRSEEDKERLSRVLGSLQGRAASSLDNRDIRFIAAAIGSSSSIREKEVAAILAEIERRQNVRLIRSIFKSLLAGYRDDVLRARLRSFLVGHFDLLTSSMQQFAAKSGILNGDVNLVLFGKELSQSRDIFQFCVSAHVASNILSTNYGAELKLASIRAALVDPKPEILQQLFDWVFVDINGTPIGDYYETILSPFKTNAPPVEVQKLLMGICRKLKRNVMPT